ncbi:molybdopterin guanine dinucleotide-containing S/N-oxide reductase [Rhodoplanes sp. Z2-YC6860]|uniref:molybdopterin guanine dinucleotide-containing S/N-oxide reductase n=1 Tax=Rhodoplanes sp. Z2-YC6860 TaxID=674703 RepID=UPI00078CACCE|nr:molybdopterin guanine dinucleotide-containing S/N-oxide reductase [Rhodoplanes sp. Z2-YC6860]AMN39355.1 molybdopterin oxidoreductase [Rhodoplanes sp. Z2-YC6860]
MNLVRHHSHWGAFLAEVEDGRIVGVRPFERDPDPSTLIDAIPQSVHSKSRIAQPMVREGWLKHGRGHGEGRGREPFVPVTWDRALDLVASEIDRVRREHGHAAIMGGSQGWSSAGIFHEARVQLHRFLAAGGGYTDQVMNYSFGAALAFLPHILGTPQAVVGPLTSWSSIARHSKLLVLFGGANPKNTQVSKGGCASHSTGPWIDELARAGVEVINISPIREDGPEPVRPQWLPIRPNTDTALLLALTHTLVSEGLHDRAFLERHCEGYERVRPYLMGESDGTPKSADWAAPITGISADIIRALARRMASTRTMLTASWSLQRAHHGEQPYWAMVLLASAIGQIGLPGGGFGFGYGSGAGIGDPPLAFAAPAMEGIKNPINVTIPAARISDCLLNPGAPFDFNGKRSQYPDIRLVYWAGGNPFHHHQDTNKLRRAFARPETVVVHEPWWTATARHADIVLPATTSLERNDIGGARRDNFIIAMHRAIAPVGEARDDFAIFTGLAERLGFADVYTKGRDEDAWLRHLYEQCRHSAGANAAAVPDFDSFWSQGYLEVPAVTDEYVLFADFRADPDKHKLKTPSGRIELYSEKIAGFGYEDCPPHPTWMEPWEWLGGPDAKNYPLHLVSSQPRDRLHSQMDCGPVSAGGKVADREAITLNPADAKARGIADGDIVRVHNARGSCLAGAIISDAISAGVVRLSCGAWFDPADADPTMCVHGNSNVLTRDQGTSKLAQGPSSATALVEVERFTGTVEPVRAFVPPRVAVG